MALTGDDLERYARHLVLREVGGPGQAKLRSARVLVIGAGGLGAPLLQYLAAAGIGTLGIVDDDTVSLSNLQRQVIHGTPDIGRFKTESAADAIRRLNPGVTVIEHRQRLDGASARGLVVDEQVLEEGMREIGHESGAKALLYATKLKAKVKRIHAEHKEHFKVQASLNKTVFQSKDEMEIRAKSSRDAYLYIFNVGQDNSVTVLYPNRFAQDHSISAGKELVFPDDKLRSIGVVLRVVPPAGAVKATERIKLIAATQKIDLGKDRFKEGVFQVYDGKDTGLITDLLKTLSTLDDSEWAESTIAYQVNR